MSGLFPFIFQPPAPYAQIQFGWRLLVVMEFSLISLFLCSVAGIQHSGRRTRLPKFGSIVLLVMSAAPCLDVVARFHNVAISPNPLKETEQVKWRLSSIEFFPVSTDVKQRVDLAIKPFTRYATAGQAAFGTTESVKIVDAERKGARFKIRAIASAPTPIMIKQLYFPGWKAFDEHGAEMPVFRDEATRLASYIVPSGDHTIVIERVATKQEHWGNVISLMALFLLALKIGFLAWRQIARTLRD